MAFADESNGLFNFHCSGHGEIMFVLKFYTFKEQQLIVGPVYIEN